MANTQVHPLFREILRSVSEPPAIRMCPACYGDLSEPCEECGSRGYLVNDRRDDAEED